MGIKNTDLVILMNKTTMTFLAVLTVGMLLTGQPVSAQVLREDHGIIVGPAIIGTSHTVQELGLKVTTRETYNGGLAVVKDASGFITPLNVETKYKAVEEITPMLVPLHKFKLLVFKDGNMQQPYRTVNFEGDLKWRTFTLPITEEGTYVFVIEGVQGANEYYVQITQ